MGRRKRHHTVSKALLKGFANHHGQVTMWRRDGASHRQAIGDASVVTDFYAFDNDDQLDDAVEQWLGDATETEFAKLLPDLRNGAQPQAVSRDCIAHYVATAVTRTRTARSYMDQIDHQLQGIMVMMALARRQGWKLTALSRSEQLSLRARCSDAWDALGPVHGRDASLLRTLVRHSQQARDDLARYSWSVSTSPHPVFLIGDAPVVTISGQASGWRGLLPKGCVVCLPLSPTSVLVGQPSAFHRSDAVGDLPSVLNQRTSQEAYHAVFSHPDMPWPADLPYLRSAPPRLPEPTISMSRSQEGVRPTFPAEYPEITDLEAAAVLRHLGSVEVVE